MVDEYDASYQELLHWRAGEITDKSLESTRRMRGLIDNSKDAGGQMLNNLDDQKAKLKAIDGQMATVAAQIDEADENLTRAECCGLWRWPWKRKSASQNQENPKAEKEGLLSSQKGNPKTGKLSSNEHSEYITRITHDSREDEMEENLQYVHGGVNDLRNFGLQIKSEVLAQNKLVDNIATKGESNIAHVKGANRRTEKIFK